MAPALSEEQLWEALDEVKDPELPVVSVVELGVVRQLERSADGVTVRLTPTFSGCPALAAMREAIREKLLSLGLRNVSVETVLSPAWTSDWITQAGREKLELYGVAPPGPASDLLQLEPDAVRCPRCGSFDTVTKNSFGPTRCKSLHVCNACREPFEAFKAV